VILVITNKLQIKFFYALRTPIYRENMGKRLHEKVLTQFNPITISQQRVQKWIELVESKQ
jgi:hypothetical protein